MALWVSKGADIWYGEASSEYSAFINVSVCMCALIILKIRENQTSCLLTFYLLSFIISHKH